MRYVVKDKFSNMYLNIRFQGLIKIDKAQTFPSKQSAVKTIRGKFRTTLINFESYYEVITLEDAKNQELFSEVLES